MLHTALKSINTVWPDTSEEVQMTLSSLVSLYLQSEGRFTVLPAYHGIRITSVAGLGIIITICDDAYAHFCACYTNQQRNAPAQLPQQLCGRPPRRRNVPLSTLHDVFRDFAVEMECTASFSLRSENHDAKQALRAAATLCASMGESFGSNTAHSEKFDQCAKDILDPWHWETRRWLASRNGGDGWCGRALENQDGRIIALREDSRDIGLDGDALGKLARHYDLYRRMDHLHDGAPMFLNSVIGPILFVSSAFYDGSSTVIEPLSKPCYMLRDKTDERVE
ncbi:hypothetical protein HGRIS_001197 [Hohenbuehelia grisea]|uniref:Uncharacterized protein n=1 Tax=Hohenbuehelia grisea TaxID=104357 RepID=A0ABR3JPC1_9AGAR